MPTGALIISTDGEWRYVSNGQPAAVVAPPPPPTYKSLNLTGATGSGARVTENGSLNMPGDHTIYALIKMTDFSPAQLQIICSKWADAGNQRSYVWGILGADLSLAGAAYFQYSSNGTAFTERSTPVASPLPTDNAWIWLRLRFTAATQQVMMSTAPALTPDPTVNPAGLTWTQVAVTGTTTAAPTIFSSTARFTIGGIDALDYRPLNGSVAQLIVANASATQVFKLDPSNWTTGTTWVTSTGHTVTLVGAGATIANI